MAYFAAMPIFIAAAPLFMMPMPLCRHDFAFHAPRALVYAVYAHAGTLDTCHIRLYGVYDAIIQ